MTWSRINNLDPTDINTQMEGSATALTDVIAYDRYYGDYCGYAWFNGSTGLVGLTTCEGIVSGSNPRCEQHGVRISNSFVDAAGTFQERQIACHENGHTLGLQHRPSSATTSCMPDNMVGTATYDGHDQSIINANY
jgi:hypothetical protein